MHESEKQELRRVVLRVLQKDFHSLSAAQFESWTRQVLTKLDRMEQNIEQLNQRVTDLHEHLEQLESKTNGQGANGQANGEEAGLTPMPMDEARLTALVEAVVKELQAAGAFAPAATPPAPLDSAAPAAAPAAELTIDLPDPTTAEARRVPGIDAPRDPAALRALMAATTARLGVGRAGPRFRTTAWLRFQADHAITQDALYRDVDPAVLDALGLFTVQTRVTGGKQEYLLRPDLGRRLSDDARRTITEKCIKAPNIQLVVGDGLSAAAVEANVREMFPVIQQGAQAAGLTVGTPFFIQYCRVGVLNDIGDLLHPDVVILLIGERPGLGRADALSAYLAYRPKAGDTDADRDVVCNIFNGGGTNPLEAAAFCIQIAQKMIKHGASGVRLKRLTA